MNKDELYGKIAEQKEEMSPKERMDCYLQGKEVDFNPFSLLAPEDALANIWGYRLKDLRESFENRVAFLKRKKIEYGIDGYHIGLGLRGLGEILGSEIYYPDNSTDYVQKHILTDYKDISRLTEFEINRSPKVIGRLNEAFQIRRLFPEIDMSTDVAGPITSAVSIRPIESILRDIRKNPEKLSELLEISVAKSIDWVKLFFEKTGTTSIFISDPVTTTDILPYRLFTQFSRPYFKKLFSQIEHITGRKPSVHICGHTKEIWGDLKDIGLNYLSLDNRESLREAKEVIGNDILISGNVDPVEVLRNGSIDDVIENTRKCLVDCSDSPRGFLLSSGCQVPIGTPIENIDAFYYAARKYGRSARIGKTCEGLKEYIESLNM